MRKHSIVTIDTVSLVRETDKAYLFDTGNLVKGKDAISGITMKIWLPKSQCEWDGKELQLQEWLADEKGLI